MTIRGNFHFAYDQNGLPTELYMGKSKDHKILLQAERVPHSDEDARDRCDHRNGQYWHIIFPPLSPYTTYFRIRRDIDQSQAFEAAPFTISLATTLYYSWNSKESIDNYLKNGHISIGSAPFAGGTQVFSTYLLVSPKTPT
jgi:hypothetical protein